MANQAESKPLDISQCWPIVVTDRRETNDEFDAINHDGQWLERWSSDWGTEHNGIGNINDVSGNLPYLGIGQRLSSIVLDTWPGDSFLAAPLAHLEWIAQLVEPDKVANAAATKLLERFRALRDEQLNEWVDISNTALQGLKNAYVRLTPNAYANSPGVLARLRSVFLGEEYGNEEGYYRGFELSLSGKDDVIGVVPEGWEQMNLYLPVGFEDDEEGADV